MIIDLCMKIDYQSNIDGKCSLQGCLNIIANWKKLTPGVYYSDSALRFNFSKNYLTELLTQTKRLL